MLIERSVISHSHKRLKHFYLQNEYKVFKIEIILEYTLLGKIMTCCLNQIHRKNSLVSDPVMIISKKVITYYCNYTIALSYD